MKILILTQKVNVNDPILGFFHRWIEEFAKHFEKITVICLEKGEYRLPSNVKVVSLGKEEGESKIKYILNFYKYIWKFRKEYDAVFVHMNQEYILLGGLVWRLIGKKVTMWRNHHSGSLFTDIAVAICNKIFCTSKYSYTAKFKKTVLMPVGIDDNIFKIDPVITRIPNSILFIARISPSKRPHLLLDALGELHKRRIDFIATIVGDPLQTDLGYLDSLKKQAESLGINKQISFKPGVKNTDTVPVYNSHEICVNLSSSGMYDKTIFEGALCGDLSLSANRNLKDEFPEELVFKENNIIDLSEKIERLLSMPVMQKESLIKSEIDFIKLNHTLYSLGIKIKEELSK